MPKAHFHSTSLHSCILIWWSPYFGPWLFPHIFRVGNTLARIWSQSWCRCSTKMMSHCPQRVMVGARYKLLYWLDANICWLTHRKLQSSAVFRATAILITENLKANNFMRRELLHGRRLQTNFHVISTASLTSLSCAGKIQCNICAIQSLRVISIFGRHCMQVLTLHSVLKPANYSWKIKDPEKYPATTKPAELNLYASGPHSVHSMEVFTLPPQSERTLLRQSDSPQTVLGQSEHPSGVQVDQNSDCPRTVRVAYLIGWKISGDLRIEPS